MTPTEPMTCEAHPYNISGEGSSGRGQSGPGEQREAGTH